MMSGEQIEAGACGLDAGNSSSSSSSSSSAPQEDSTLATLKRVSHFRFQLVCIQTLSSAFILIPFCVASALLPVGGRQSFVHV